jgi:hypothetical protein
MNFLDILNRYAAAPPGHYPPEAIDHFGEVAQNAPREVVSEGLADAFRDEQTPPFPDMVAQLYEHSNPGQRAGLLELFRRFRGAPKVSEQDAGALEPHQVRDIAQRAEEHNPGVVERVSEFYSRHPDLVRNLGSMALSIALRNIARRSAH